MNVFKLILIAAAVWIVWRLLQGVRVHISRIQPPPPPPAKPEFEPMARCEKCGVHLPASAISAGGLCGKCAGDAGH